MLILQVVALVDGITATKKYVDDNIPTVPTNVSEFNNDASYANEQYVDDAIATALADITGIEYHVCVSGEYDATTLIPTLQGESGVIYLVPKPVSTIGQAVVGQSRIGKDKAAESGSAVVGQSAVYSENHSYTDDSDNNIYFEYIYNGTYFEKIGDTSVSLEGYVREDDVAEMSDVEQMLTELGLLDNYGTADNAIVGSALVG